jgi:DnaJ-class molecular chaperone
MIICHNCKGNGYVKLRFEGETAIEQCKVCNSSGEVKDDEYYSQSWDDGSGACSVYYGPPLEAEGDEGFKNYKIYPIKASDRF